MKKTLLVMMLAASFVTTGCGHKKRVERLESEILRCRAELQKARSSTESQTPGDAEFAVVDER